MKTHWFRLFVAAFPGCLGAVFLPGALAQEQAPCDAPSPWECFGQMEVTLNYKGQMRTAGILRYGNGDVQVYVDTPEEGKKQALTLFALRPNLSKGLSGNEKDVLSGDNPFRHFNFNFMPMIVSLNHDYPSGIDAVAPQWQETSGQEVDEATGHVLLQWEMRTRQVWRDGTPVVEVELIIAGDDEAPENIRVTGFWSPQRAPALPDSFDLTGWEVMEQDGIDEEFRTLGELRHWAAQASNAAEDSGTGEE